MRGNFLYLGKVPPFPLQKPARGRSQGIAPAPHELLKKFNQNFYLSATLKKRFPIGNRFFH